MCVVYGDPEKGNCTPTVCGFIITLILGICVGGCVERSATENSHPFENAELGGALAILVDTSGSFSDVWDERAYRLFLEISDRYFTEAMGSETKIVIGGLSGSKEVILFEGKPSDLRRKFRTPKELSDLLRQKSDPRSSNCFEATRRTIDYLRSLPGVTDRTKLMTIVFSDMQDSETNAARKAGLTDSLVASLKSYSEQGGALALYFVSEGEREHVYEVLRRSNFPSTHYVVEGELSASPQLPSFD